MVKVVVNDCVYVCSTSITLLNLCRIIGLTDYKFCYHESLPVAGNCRICLVELEDLDKQIAGCVTNVESNNSIWTYNMFAKKARENVLSILLINHPLDCPICDQGGECDLQDQVKVAGSFMTRFYFNKKVVKDKRTGIFISTIMTRCIHCLRCVRFNKLIGQNSFGILNRTNRSEIVFHSFGLSTSDFSGVTIDLCPVGALTGRQYAFKYRPWELKSIESIDHTDGLGANTYLMYKDYEILKISPKSNHYLNGNIISDTARFSFEANTSNRLELIYQLEHSKKTSKIISWTYLLNNLSNLAKSKNLCFFVTDETELNALLFLKKKSYINYNSIKVFNWSNTFRTNLFINKPCNFLETFDHSNEFCLLLGLNPSYECLLLNLKLRLKHKKSLVSIFCIGRQFSNKYSLKSVGVSIFKATTFFNGKLNLLTKMLNIALCPLIVFGESYFKKIVNFEIIIAKINNKFNSLKLLKLFLRSNSNGLNFLNIRSATKLKASYTFFFFNLTETVSIRKLLLNVRNIVWFTSFKVKPFFYYDYIVPVESQLETEGYFINMEQRIQKTQRFIYSAKSIFSILNAIFYDNAEFNSFTFYYLNYFYEVIKNFKQFVVFFCIYNLETIYSKLIINFANLTSKSVLENYQLNLLTKYSQSLQLRSKLALKNNFNFPTLINL